MVGDFEFFNDEWNKADTEKSDTFLPGVEGSIEGTSSAKE